MPTIETGGHTLYYELHGDGEPLVCVMGLAADTLAWTLQVPAFSARHRTLIFDNRDVGRSSLADAVTFAAGSAYARRLSEVWASRVHKISREEHVDELLLLCNSEEFFENAEAVATVRGLMLENPHFQPPEAFARQ